MSSLEDKSRRVLFKKLNFFFLWGSYFLKALIHHDGMIAAFVEKKADFFLKSEPNKKIDVTAIASEEHRGFWRRAQWREMSLNSCLGIDSEFLTDA